MSIETFFDHVALPYRLTETPNALGEHVNTYTAEAASENLHIKPSAESSVDEGAGEALRGELRGHARVDANIQKEDVLQVTSGPLAPANFRVLTVVLPQGHRSAPHHMRLTLERYAGVLP